MHLDDRRDDRRPVAGHDWQLRAPLVAEADLDAARAKPLTKRKRSSISSAASSDWREHLGQRGELVAHQRRQLRARPASIVRRGAASGVCSGAATAASTAASVCPSEASRTPSAAVDGAPPRVAVSSLLGRRRAAVGCACGLRARPRFAGGAVDEPVGFGDGVLDRSAWPARGRPGSPRSGRAPPTRRSARRRGRPTASSRSSSGDQPEQLGQGAGEERRGLELAAWPCRPTSPTGPVTRERPATGRLGGRKPPALSLPAALPGPPTETGGTRWAVSGLDGPSAHTSPTLAVPPKP